MWTPTTRRPQSRPDLRHKSELTDIGWTNEGQLGFRDVLKAGLMITKGLYSLIFFAIANALPRTNFFNTHRAKLYRLAGFRIGPHTTIVGPLMLELELRAGNIGNVVIGEQTFMNTQTWLNCRESSITIGNNVLIGPRVAFETGTHSVTLDDTQHRRRQTKPIVVEDNVWIGAGAMILPGVTVHDGAVVAAGAVVAKNVDPSTLVGGVPARKIKEIARV